MFVRFRGVLQGLSLLAGLAAIGILFAVFGLGGVTEGLSRLRPGRLGLYLILAILQIT